MRQTIYLDILFLLNMLVTYLLLSAVSLLTAVPAKRVRLLLAILLGGIFSLLIFLEMHPVESFAVKLLTGCALTAAAFYHKKTARVYWRVTASFFLISFLFAGFITAVFLLFPAQGMVYRNGVLYFKISAFMLAVSTTAAYLLIRLVCGILDRRKTGKAVKDVYIHYGGKTVQLRALVDTGNHLRDPFSGLPVIVASFESVKALLPVSLHAYVQSGIPPDIPVPMLRFIPVKTVSGERLLASFIPEEMQIDQTVRKGVLAVSSAPVKGGEYDALLHPALAE